MPTYGYKCTVCQYTLDIFQKITDAPIKLCEKCGHESLVRGPGGGIGLIFKGSGFYKTDYPPTVESAPKPQNGGGCCPCGKGSCSSP